MIYVVGHRGAAKVLPENTLKGFAYAIDLGVDAVECDVHMTEDEHLVVMHDVTVDRTTNGSGAIREMSFEAVRSLDAGQGEQVPTLAEVLALAQGKVTVLCELKGEGTEAAAVEAVDRQGMAAEVVFTSFEMERLARVRAMGAHYRIGAIFSDPAPEDIQAAVALGAAGIGIHHQSLTPRLVDRVRSAGLDLRAWNPDTLAGQKAMIGLGVDGIGTNRPDILLSYLRETS